MKGDGDPRTRSETCRVLGKVGTQASVPLLEELVTARSSAELGRVASEAAKAIARRNPTEDELTHLRSDLESADGRVRHDAVVRLAQVTMVAPRRAEVAHAVEPLLTDRDGDTQTWAVRALGVWSTETSRDALQGRIADKDFQPWREAIKVLSEIAPDDEATARALRPRLTEDPRLILETWKKLGPVAEPAAIAALENPDGDIRREISGVLGSIGTEKAVAKLEELATDKKVPGLDQAAREAAKTISARAVAQGSLTEILRLLETTDIFRRGDAIRRLMTVPPARETRTQVARTLEKYLSPEEVFGQEELYKALGAWGDEQTPKRLIPLVSDKENHHWGAAMDALIALGPDEAALRAIIRRFPDDPRRVCEALRPVAAKAEPLIFETVMRGKEPRVRIKACRWLGTFGSSSSQPELEALARQALPEDLTRVAEEALKANKDRY